MAANRQSSPFLSTPRIEEVDLRAGTQQDCRSVALRGMRRARPARERLGLDSGVGKAGSRRISGVLEAGHVARLTSSGRASAGLL